MEKDVKVVQLIKTTLERRGEGIEGDPVRIIEQYWDFKGSLVFEFDSYKQEVSENNTLTKVQIDAVVNWMNTWEQLKDTAIPIRFKESFKKFKIVK